MHWHLDSGKSKKVTTKEEMLQKNLDTILLEVVV